MSDLSEVLKYIEGSGCKKGDKFNPWDIERFVKNFFGSKGAIDIYEGDAWDFSKIVNLFYGVRSSSRGKLSVSFSGVGRYKDKIKVVIAIYIVFGSAKSASHIRLFASFIVELLRARDPQTVRPLSIKSKLKELLESNDWSDSTKKKVSDCANVLAKILSGQYIGYTKNNRSKTYSTIADFKLNNNFDNFRVESYAVPKSNLSRSKKEIMKRTANLMVDTLELRSLLKVLDASNHTFSKIDKLMISVTKLQLITGCRIGEILSLQWDCLLVDSDDVYFKVYPEKTNIGGAKYCGEVGAPYSSVLTDLIHEVQSLYSEARENSLYVSRCISKNKNILTKNDFDVVIRKKANSMVSTDKSSEPCSGGGYKLFIREYEAFSKLFYVDEISSELWMTLSYTERNKIKSSVKSIVKIYEDVSGGKYRPNLNSPKQSWVCLDELNDAIKASFVSLNGSLRSTALFAQCIEDSLFIVPKNEKHSVRHSRRWEFEVIQDYNVHGMWSGHNREIDIFEKYDLKEFKNLKAGHALRRLMTSDLLLANISGHFTAKWMGRMPDQNFEYLYYEQVSRELSNAVSSAFESGDVSSVIDLDSFEFFDEVFTASNIMTRFFQTGLGGCQHDFSASPCPHHLKCYNGCGQLLLKVDDKQVFSNLQEEKQRVEVSIQMLESSKRTSLPSHIIKTVEESIESEQVKLSNLNVCLNSFEVENTEVYVKPFS